MKSLINDNTIQYLGKFAQVQLGMDLDAATDFAIEIANIVLDAGKHTNLKKGNAGLQAEIMWSKERFSMERGNLFLCCKIGMLIQSYNNIVLTLIRKYPNHEEYKKGMKQVAESEEPEDYSIRN